MIAAEMSRPTIGSASGNPSENPGGAEDDGQGGEAVDPGVHAVGDQRRRADPSADPDAVDRHGLVAGEADQPGRDDPPQVVQRLRMEQPVDGLPGRDDGGEGDDRDDEQPGQVFGPAVAIGVAAVGGTAAQDECDPQRHGGQGVGEVVDGVRQQGHGTADEDHQELQDRGAQQQRRG